MLPGTGYHGIIKAIYGANKAWAVTYGTDFPTLSGQTIATMLRSRLVVLACNRSGPPPVLPPLGGGIGCAGILLAPMQARRLRLSSPRWGEGLGARASCSHQCKRDACVCPPPAGGRDWVRGHPARTNASETLAYPGIARTDSVNASFSLLSSMLLPVRQCRSCCSSLSHRAA
jgi:hypothetical protein